MLGNFYSLESCIAFVSCSDSKRLSSHVPTALQPSPARRAARTNSMSCGKTGLTCFATSPGRPVVLTQKQRRQATESFFVRPSLDSGKGNNVEYAPLEEMSLGRKARKMTCHTQYLKRKWKSLTRRSRTPSSCSSVFSCRRRKTFLTTSPAVVSVQGLESARRKYRCSARSRTR